jgi:ribosome-binding protein aMBF1 (putative translation factor)
MRKMKSKRTHKRIEESDQAVLEARIAKQFYDLRIGMGFTKEQLAKKIGTSASVISRLEDAG